jgi:hypothetical protein
MFRIATAVAVCMLSTLAACALDAGAQTLPDAPEPRARPAAAANAPKRYADALVQWRTPEDIARFVDATFEYDRARALALAEQPDARAARPAIHSPEAMFEKPQGVCIDLARFGVETLNRIDATYAARYVMIEFEPVVIEGRSLRRHWVASFRRDGKLWVFADSRRPGHVAGPYENVDAFIADYALYRGQRIVASRETDTYLRTQRAVARATPAPRTP